MSFQLVLPLQNNYLCKSSIIQKVKSLMMGPNLEIPSDIIPPLQMKNVRHSMSKNVILSQRPFVTVLLTTKLIGMCYSHFGNGIRNGTISILHSLLHLCHYIIATSLLYYINGHCFKFATSHK